MAEIQVQENQSLMDVVVSEYGSLEAAMSVCIANNLPITALPDAGTVLELPRVLRAQANEPVVRYLKREGITIGTRADVHGVCGAISEVAVTEIGGYTAKLIWTTGTGGIGIEWIVAEDGDAPEPPADAGTGDFVAIGDDSVEMTGLTPMTEYSAFIRTKCGEDSYSPWARKVFTTIEGAMSIILRPYTTLVAYEPGAPLEYNISPFDFVSLNGLALLPSVFLQIRCQTKVQWDLYGDGTALTSLASAVDPSGTYVRFDEIPTYEPGDIQMYYSDISTLSTCILYFKDNADYLAACAPFVLYSEGEGLVTMLGQMILGVGYWAGETFVLPVTIDHMGVSEHFAVAPDGMAIAYQIDDTWHPLELSLNPSDVVYLNLEPGVHKLGLFTNYISNPSGGVGPQSLNTMIIEITA